PTGYLHVGGARTALFNWLYARHEGGKFLLRIEDTDKARSTDEHTQVILDGLTWLGLDWVEELVFQGVRVKRHQETADRLLAEGKAYMDEGAIRFRLPPGEIAWEDAVHGRISFQGADIKDFIILRSDRTPIYNLAVVVDDLDMGITHVLRGDDHISNTPKQIALYQALNAPLPVFGHVPMINGPDGKKLSKRHGATAVGDYQHMGILPAAMRNFLALLGWSPGGDREIMTLDEMIQLFSFAGIQQKAAIFDMTKLEWMNGQYLSMTPAEDLYPLVAPQPEKLGVNGNREAVHQASRAAVPPGGREAWCQRQQRGGAQGDRCGEDPLADHARCRAPGSRPVGPETRRRRREGKEGDREGSGGLQGVARGRPRRPQGGGLDAGGAGADVARAGGAAGRRRGEDFPADPDRAHWRNRFGAGQRAAICGGERSRAAETKNRHHAESPGLRARARRDGASLKDALPAERALSGRE